MRRPAKDPRGPVKLTLPKTMRERLHLRADETGEAASRFVERAVKALEASEPIRGRETSAA